MTKLPASHSKIDEPCWNCGGNEFKNSNSSGHLANQIICASCYEPAEDDESYYETEESYY